MAPSNAGRRGATGNRLCVGERTATPAAPVTKLLVVGGPASGKSTVVSTVSDVDSVAVEAVDSTYRARATTVAMDFGRVTVDGEYTYLFGTPGPSRFRFMWDRLARGAGGALLVADVRRLSDGAPARAYLAGRRLPFVVLVNLFDDAAPPATRRVREALALPAAVPVLACDARARPAVRSALVTALARLKSGTRTAPASAPPHLSNNRCGLPLTPPNDREHP